MKMTPVNPGSKELSEWPDQESLQCVMHTPEIVKDRCLFKDS